MTYAPRIMRHTPRVLIIAGSDSGGGAGIQGDLKTVTALGGYGMTAITALTAQNTLGVFGIHPVPEEFIRQQIGVVLEDIGADAVKTGMLHSASVIEAVATALQKWNLPLILDPVMVAKGGAPLLQLEAMAALKALLIPRAALITPNLPEAELLLGRKITSSRDHAHDMLRAAEELLALGAAAVLLKGGHGSGAVITDVLASRAAAPVIFTSPRIDTRHTHGTGCTLASAIATSIAAGLPVAESVARAREYVYQAILTAPGLGHGHGPLGWGAARGT
jgi:hydroxymethylpyrimidine/phosphomethylpyrimidine kinase